MPAGTEKVGLPDLRELRISASGSPRDFSGVPDLPANRRLSVVNLGASLQNLPSVGTVAPTTAPGEYVDYSQHSEISMRLADSKRPWYKEAVFYELYVRAFYDSDADGHGDIVGLTAKLDYLHALGVDCLWLLPIHPSPLRDDGYDVADYMGVHPTYGNLDAFKTFVNAVHERSMRVIMDFIPNHSSDQHEWFQLARRDPNSPYRDYYVWSDDPEKYKDARVIFIDTEKSNWTWDEVAGQYYWHRFFSSQPDLNFDNPKVREEMLNIMRHWLDIGIDGFRVDAVPYLFEEEGTNCENLARTHLFIKEMRRMVDTEYPGCILLAEACQMPAQVREYFGDGDEFHMGFHFPVMPRIFMSIRKEEYTSLQKILEETPDIPPNCQWCTFLRNHDELTLEMVTNEERKWMWEKFAPEPRMRINLGIRRRLAPLLDNDRRQIELAYSLLFTMPGSPILYYGDEICMGDNIWLPDRNGVRTPMQWDDTRNAGFSTSSALYTPVVRSEEYGPHRVNVKLAQADPSSLFHAIRFMIAQRRKHSSFGFGTIRWVPCENLAIAVYIRSHTIDQVLVVSNLSSSSQTATINLKGALTDLEDTNTAIWVSDILTAHRFKISKHQTLHITLEPYQFLWLHIPLA